MKSNNNLFDIDQAITNNPTEEEDTIDLGELFTTLIDSKWLIMAITTLALIIGIAKAMLSTPIYRVDAMLQVEETSQPLAGLESMEGFLGGNLPVQAEIEIVKSRAILGATIKSLNLEIIAKPVYFPIIGKTIARRFKQNNKNTISPPLLGYSEYAWGGELLKVETLILPLSWEGKTFTLIAGEKGLFKIIDSAKQLIIEGEIGKNITKKIDKEDREFQVFISILNARPNTVFTISKKPLITAIAGLKSGFSVSEKGKGTGILSLTMDSTSPSLAMQTLNKIARIYVRSNVEQKSEEAQSTLSFLKIQLPIIKSQLDAATVELNEYRLQRGSVDLSFETQIVLESVVESKTQITLLQQKKEELRERFTPFHPAVLAVERQIRRLAGKVIQSNKEITELPETQQEILKLSRDVQVTTTLYTTLLDHLQTIKVAKAGTVGDVRVIDYAMLPINPIKPNKPLIVIISLIIGLLVGIAFAFIRKAINHGITDPNILENHLNVPVYATVPHSHFQEKINTRLKKGKSMGGSSLLLEENIDDPAIESLRSLRTTLHFAFLDAKNNILMITGSRPGIGKTFIATNLAHVLASSGKRVLLIDGDLRKGYMNKLLGVEREKGLSELIANDISTDEAIKTLQTADGTIDFISTGEIPPNPSELLLHERFGSLLNSFSQQYDQIVIDTPPVLAVTDACIIGGLASVTLMVVKAGEHPLRELEQSVKRLQQNNVKIKGIVFNDVSINASMYGYGKYVYQYNYS